MASFKALSLFLSLLLLSFFSLASGAETEQLITEAATAVMEEPEAVGEALVSVMKEEAGEVKDDKKTDKKDSKASKMEKLKNVFRKLKFWGKKPTAQAPKAEEPKVEAAPAAAPAAEN